LIGSVSAYGGLLQSAYSISAAIDQRSAKLFFTYRTIGAGLRGAKKLFGTDDRIGTAIGIASTANTSYNSATGQCHCFEGVRRYTSL
jgi:hypothetical protein